MIIRHEVYRLIKTFLRNKTQGATHNEIYNYLVSKLKKVSKNTINGAMWHFRQRIIKGIEKDVVSPSKGLYINAKYLEHQNTQTEIVEIIISEEKFYNSFANYLVNELEECTKAIPLGGKKFQDKWGTPDVIGVYKFSEAEPIKPPLEIVSAEIKLDQNQLVTAFGQACSYKIFSHKVYLVVPNQAQNDIPRLESLCMRFGIGLILYNNQKVNNPKFQIRTRAIKSEPDYYFLNLYIKKLSTDEIRQLLG